GPVLSRALCMGILSSGCDVIDIGMVPTPILYYSTFVLNTKSGVMLTGSHNPPDYNGLKMMVNGKTLAEESIQALYQSIIDHRYKSGEGQLAELDLVERYINHIDIDVKLPRPLKIVVDCGNGVAGSIAPELFRRMGCDVHELFCEVDGHFPNHHPDPSQTENLEDLIRTVKENKADLGIAFDGDGDRIGIVTNTGRIVWPDRLLMLFANALLKKKPGAKIIYDVKCSMHLGPLIKELGGEPIMWKTGHSLIKSKLAETQAALAGEMSGHIFFKDRWYGFDDAIYAGARLLQIIASHTQSSEELFSLVPDSVNTPELKIYVEENEKFLLMKQLIAQAKFSDAEHITIDGLRVNFANGWGLVRPSNTTPCLVLRFEAKSENILTKIQELFRELLLSVNPKLVLPF
ncbi:MAG: phosphomannomutase/phosphoglucomutase, partial [Gammaproteobacteria bacterium]|nr:phosphomannomutase/phosphoglucomutase [Gammaproteobacteria bacterium]